ncbi:Allantoicase [Tulasnella sp. UAMH 9824]|nr:Allantoicase [Tulasnella sp. UAMH 9824]
MAKYHVIDFEDFQTKLGAAGTELSSVALGGKVVAVSDDFFADVTNLIKVEPSQSLKGQFGPNGALFDGWESRRHNPTYDWCIIKLGTPGHIIGFDIDTAHFNGNEAPQASVEALFLSEGDPTQTDERWEELLPKVNLGPSSRHLYGIEKTPRSYTHVKLNMYPDGGIGRFRVYGEVSPIFPEASKAIDLAHVFSGGRVVYVSNQHFGIGPNLLLPGRGKDMGDGWETRRSRLPGHKDFVVIRLGAPGVLEEVEIDTAHFKGNFPESCELHATRTGSTIPHDDVTWTTILSRTKLGPHRRHFFQLENVLGQVYTHVRLTIYPDGGIKRIRVIGRRAEAHKESAEVEAHEPTTTPFKVPPPQTIALNGINGHVNGINGINGINGHHTPVVKRRPSDLLRIPAVPLTPEAFAKFGHVIQAWADPTAVPKGVRVTSANQGTAHKFHRLAPTTSFYPESSKVQAVSAISVFRSTPVGAKPGEDWEVKLLERHAYTSQAFIPMGSGRIDHLGLDDGLSDGGRAYLVVVALNGGDDSPDLSTLRAFVATTAQGISYSPGIWHHPMISLETPIDFACVETQIGEPNNKMDCEILDLEQLGRDILKVKVPLF